MRQGLTKILSFMKRYLFSGVLLVTASVCFLVPGRGDAEQDSLLSLSLRTRVSGATTLGDPQPEEFQEVDLATHFRLPWTLYAFNAGWNIGTQLMASAGVLRSSGTSGLVVSYIPEVVFGSDDGRFTLDMGAGFALLSRYSFGTQDYGGPFQFALTAGAGVPLYKRFGLGYRFLHYSDAAVNGADTIGADFHMIELRYRFDDD